MPDMKRRVIFLVAISLVLVLIVVVGKPIYTTSHYNSETERNIEILDFMIRDFNYKISESETSKASGNTLFYMLGIRTNKIDFKEYTILNGAEADISTFNQEQFIISLHSNETIACKWETDYNHQYLEIIDQYFFQPNRKQIKSNQVIGGSERRVNFRFRALRKGSSTISFKQVSEDGKTVYDTFKINLLAINNQGKDTTAINNVNQIKDMEKLTPAQILDLYIVSLKNGDNKTLNSIYSKRALESINSGKGYESFPSQEIKDVKINVDESKTNDTTESNYNLSFVLEKVTDPPFFYQGTGEYYYFVHLIRENDIWKIDALATSP